MEYKGATKAHKPKAYMPGAHMYSSKPVLEKTEKSVGGEESSKDEVESNG